jgi:hypothetical protein
MDNNIIDILLNKSYDLYLSRIEHAIQMTKLVRVCNYIIIFKVIKDNDGHDFKTTDIFMFYYDINGKKHIQYKNINRGLTITYDTNIKDIRSFEIEKLVSGGTMDIYGYVSCNNANYNITKKEVFASLSVLHDEFNKLLLKW